MGETRKLAAILVSDVVGYSRLAGTDEDRTLSRLRGLRSDLIDPTIAVHHGRVVKRTGDGAIVEFRSVVDAVNCAIEVQRAMIERNAGVAPDKLIEFWIGIHLGDGVMLGTAWIDRQVDTQGRAPCFHALLSAAWKHGHAQANDRHSSRVFAMPPRGFARRTRNG